MHIPSVLSVPFNFIAKGFSRLSTTSGSITRYQRHDTFSEPGRRKIRVFRPLISSERKPSDHDRPFTLTADELQRRSYDESSCFHIRTRRFFGLPFRRSESAIASSYSKNVTSVFLGNFKHFDSTDDVPSLSSASSMCSARHDSIAPDGDTVSTCSANESDSGSDVSIGSMFADVIAYADRLLGRLPEQMALSGAETVKNAAQPGRPPIDSPDRHPFKPRVIDQLPKTHQK